MPWGATMVIPSPRAQAAGQARDLAPIDWWSEVEHRRKIAEKTNQALQGKLLNVGQVTLRANFATTNLKDQRIGTESFIGFMATTANAAAEIGTLYVTGRTQGAATLNHANNAQTDRDFVYIVIG